MKTFLQKAQQITAVVMLVTGFVAALAAAMKAFSETMQQHYEPAKNETANN